MKLYLYGILFLLPVSGAFAGTPPDSVRVLHIQELFDLAAQNSKTLAIAKENIAISRQQTEITRASRLPEMGAGLKFGYLSNAWVWDNHLSNRETVPVPHIANDFTVEASQVIYKGNEINHQVARSVLQEQLAAFNYAQDEEDIRFLLLGRYFNLYELRNQQEVYEHNIALAEERLGIIHKLHQEGMVTQNDIIRSELQLTNLRVALDAVKDNLLITSHELCVVLGLPPATRLEADTSIDIQEQAGALEENIRQAYVQNPAIQAGLTREAIAAKDIDIAKASALPVLSLYAGNGLSRPFLYSIPPQDIYMNLYQAGVTLKYNISSLYHTKEKVHLARLQYNKEQQTTSLVKEKTELAVHEAWVKWQEAQRTYASLQKAFELAGSNYTIVENKYYNQFAVLTDMLDASTARLNAELEMNSARANIRFRWYQLQKATGAL